MLIKAFGRSLKHQIRMLMAQDEVKKAEAQLI